jgi:hypothetical protein
MSIIDNGPIDQAPEPITLAGGDTPASFDEIEALVETKPEKTEKPKAKESEDKPKKEKKDEDEKDEEKSKEVEPKDGKDAPPKEGELAKETKAFKLKIGDQETEVRADALVPVKIAGKTEMVPLQDVVNNYSGATHLNRQYAEFKAKSEAHKAEIAEVDQAFAKLHELAVVNKDPRGTIELIAQAMGADPKQLFEDMSAKMMETFEAYAALSPEDRAKRKTEEELNYYRSKDEARKQKAAETQKAQSYEKQVEEIITKSGMDKPTFVSRYEELAGLGSIKKEDITPEMVAKFHGNMVALENVEKMVTQYAPELENKESEIQRLSQLAIQTGATALEIEEVVKSLYANQAERKLSKKISSMEKKAKGESPVRDPQKEPTFFDDLG